MVAKTIKTLLTTAMMRASNTVLPSDSRKWQTEENPQRKTHIRYGLAEPRQRRYRRKLQCTQIRPNAHLKRAVSHTMASRQQMIELRLVYLFGEEML